MSEDAAMRSAIAEMGHVLSPDVLAAVRKLYAADQAAAASKWAPRAVDVPYGEHPRQRLDIYVPENNATNAPIAVWVHGGGFLRGEKHSPDHPYEAHMGRFFARQGWLGVVINYRLAPDSVWPSGAEDVGQVVRWLSTHGREYGGDSRRILLAGSSAGAVHVAGFLARAGQAEGVCGAVLLSGLFGFTPLDERDRQYYGTDEKRDEERAPRNGLLDCKTPLFVSCAEFDPPRFQQETMSLWQAMFDRDGRMPRAYIANGHNHYSIACHIGSSDTRLSNEIVSFAEECFRSA